MKRYIEFILDNGRTVLIARDVALVDAVMVLRDHGYILRWCNGFHLKRVSHRRK